MPMNAAQSARDIPVSDSPSYNRPLPDTRLVACPHCDLLQRLPEVAPGRRLAVRAATRSYGATGRIRLTGRWR